MNRIVKLTIVLILYPLLVFSEQTYSCEWFSLRYPDDWVKMADFKRAGVVYIYPKVNIGPRDAMLSIYSVGSVNSYHEIKFKLLYSLYKKNNPRLEIGEIEFENFNGATIPVIVLRYPAELSLGRVSAWRYERLYYFISNGLGIVIDIEYVRKEHIKNLKYILKSIIWRGSKIRGIDKIMSKSERESLLFLFPFH